MVRFNLGPNENKRGQTRIAKFKSAYNSLIIATYKKSWARNLLVWSDLTLDTASRSNEDSQM